MTAIPTEDELRAWPLVVDLVPAASVFGIGRTKAYELAAAGTFPVPVLRAGVRYKVARAELLKAVGVEAR